MEIFNQQNVTAIVLHVWFISVQNKWGYFFPSRPMHLCQSFSEIFIPTWLANTHDSTKIQKNIKSLLSKSVKVLQNVVGSLPTKRWLNTHTEEYLPRECIKSTDYRSDVCIVVVWLCTNFVETFKSSVSWFSDLKPKGYCTAHSELPK